MQLDRLGGNEVFVLQCSLSEVARARAAESFLFQFAEIAEGIQRLQNRVRDCGVGESGGLSAQLSILLDWNEQIRAALVLAAKSLR